MSSERHNSDSILKQRVEFFQRERSHTWSAAHLRIADALVSDLAGRLADVETERDALASRQVVVVCAEHGDVLSATWEDDDGDLLVKVEPCSRCTDDAFGAGHARATGRHL